MRFYEFFNCFYKNGSKGSLIGYKSKERIPQFFMEAALGSDSLLLPTSLSSYAKWFNNERQPHPDVWSGINTASRENELIKALSKTLNKDMLNKVASNFGIIIPSGEIADRDCLAFAIARQFFEISNGSGTGANIANKAYRPTMLTFQTYAQKAFAKYSKIKTPFTDDKKRLLSDVYVCSTISSRNSNLGKTARGSVFSTDEISLSKIKEYSMKTILIGNGGMGKSIMLTYLYVNSLSEHFTSGILPILAELREFKYGSKNIIDYLVDAVTHFDSSFNESTLLKLLEQGKCQVLLDGIDEIDPSDFAAFQNQLSEITDKYPANQYVLASRECEIARALSGFNKLYLQPFNDDKKVELIDKLLTLPEDENTKADIKSFLQNQFIKEHCVFATNPMLLTFVVAKHPIIKTFHGKQSLFYKTIYETIIHGHDESKPNYSRIFHCAKDGDEFTTAFREFCAITYLDNVKEFDALEFEKYFKKIKSKSSFENPHKFTKTNFLRDACATSCMLYEKQSKLIYIDEGFQHLLFAEQMMLDEMKNVIDVEEFLSKKKDEEYYSLKGFDYFMEVDIEKVESCFFLPFLNKIFKNKNEENSYLSYLENCHSEIRYSTTDSLIIDKWKGKVETVKTWPLNGSTNVIYTMLLKQLNTSCSFILDCFPDNMDYPEFRKKTIYGEIINSDTPIQIRTAAIPGDVTYFEKTASQEKYLFEDGKPAIIGYEYEFDVVNLFSNKEKYSKILGLLTNDTHELTDCYNKLKEYYTFLSKKYR